MIEGIFNNEIRNKLTGSEIEVKECYCIILHDVDMVPVSEDSVLFNICTKSLNNHISNFYCKTAYIIVSFPGKFGDSLFLPTDANPAVIISRKI